MQTVKADRPEGMENMKKMIEDGWHKIDEFRDFLVEDGIIVRGTCCRNGGLDYKTIYPYRRDYDNSLSLWQPEATEKNLKKICWR